MLFRSEDELMDTSEFPVSASLAASQEPASVLDHPARPHTVPHAQFLMEELVAMDQVFEADVSISPFWGNNLSCINSHSTTLASRSFRQGEDHSVRTLIGLYHANSMQTHI